MFLLSKIYCFYLIWFICSIVKSFVKEYVEEGCKLPIINKLRIQEKKENGYLKMFLSNWAPNSLNQFCIEKLIGWGYIEAKEYMPNLLSFLPWVKDEIVFEWTNFKSSTELSKIIKASHQCKRIYIRGGTIHTDTVWDFGTNFVRLIMSTYLVILIN